MVKHAIYLKQKPTKFGELQKVQFLLLLFIFLPFIVINFYIFFKTKINEFAVVMALIIKKQTNIKINGLFFNNQGKYCYDFLHCKKLDALL